MKHPGLNLCNGRRAPILGFAAGRIILKGKRTTREGKRHEPIPDRKRRKSESVKPEPLAFLAKYDQTGENALESFTYDPDETTVWPDLSAHGFKLTVVGLPTGKVVDAASPTGTGGTVTEWTALLDLGFELHRKTGVWVRPHRPVYVEDFAKHFANASAATLSLKEIVRVPSRESPELAKRVRRNSFPRVSDGEAILASYRQFRAQGF
jgi:hypothetical protein